jgi:hypothetical protein
MCLQGTTGCTLGWQVTPSVTEGFDKTGIKIFQENIPTGQDSLGEWNQRIVIQFSDPANPNRTINLAGPNCFLEQYFGNVGGNIHRGGGTPLRTIIDLHTDYNNPQSTWNDDWSWDSNAVDADVGMYWPITNDWTDPDNPDVPVTTWNPKSCSQASHVVNNILVEEWDGYTWRKVAGNFPADLATASEPKVLKENHLPAISLNGSEIKFSLPFAENVRIQILDLKGSIVATLMDSFQKAGAHSLRWNKNKYASSVYFLKFLSRHESVIKKIVSTH